MPNYIVNANAQPNGDNEVHVYPQQHSSCSYPGAREPSALGRVHLVLRRGRSGQDSRLQGQRLLLLRQRLPHELARHITTGF